MKNARALRKVPATRVADEQGLLCGLIAERRQVSRAELASLTGLSPRRYPFGSTKFLPVV